MTSSWRSPLKKKQSCWTINDEHDQQVKSKASARNPSPYQMFPYLWINFRGLDSAIALRACCLTVGHLSLDDIREQCGCGIRRWQEEVESWMRGNRKDACETNEWGRQVCAQGGNYWVINLLWQLTEYSHLPLFFYHTPRASLTSHRKRLGHEFSQLQP